jgi:hypothetical protein
VRFPWFALAGAKATFGIKGTTSKLLINYFLVLNILILLFVLLYRRYVADFDIIQPTEKFGSIAVHSLRLEDLKIAFLIQL